ncbi:hypothetical protein [Flavobacterium chungangensis]|uniref:Lipoprotein n=1 Tax=Flavobacterium chungangensis TaxID=2708132 RepID=A0ABV8ZA19_9FLAO
MKFSVVFRIAVIILIVQLVSCTKEKKEVKVNKEIESDTIFNSGNPYYAFILKSNPDIIKDNELVYFKVEDIDLDGKQEAIVALGKLDKEDENNTEINQIFLLRKDNGIIKKLNTNFNDFTIINEVELVSLKGIKQKFIRLSIIERGSSHGLVLFELNGDKVKEFLSSTPVGEGSCYLIDKNNDGEYDGYVKFFFFTDAVHYEVEEAYVLKDKKFKLSQTHVKISDYPKTIEDLLLQYISLRSLEIKSSEISERLEQVCIDQDALAIKWNVDAWEMGLLEYFDDPDTLKVQIQDDNTATVTYIDDNKKTYQCQFEVAKTADKWQITKVTITKNGDEELNK